MNKTSTSLLDITLEQWIGYYNEYGRDLDSRLLAILAMAEGDERNALYLEYEVDYALCHYSHYSNTPMAEVIAMNVAAVVVEQNAAFALHKQEESAIDYSATFEWNGSSWQIQPILEHSGSLTNAEFEKTQDIALIWSDLQDDKQEALYNLCAAYFRKENEVYTSDLVDDSNERVLIMRDLPLLYVLTVKKYVEDSFKVYLNGQ